MVHTAIKHNKIKTPNWQSRQTATVTWGTAGTTGLSYFGARYLDPKTSRWTSADPALGEYVPVAPLGDEERKRNGNLPGMGGVFNIVNLHVYHYAGNNPVKYVDPDGRFFILDDLLVAIYYKLTNDTSVSLWKLMWIFFADSLKSLTDWDDLKNQIKLRVETYNFFTDITISLNDDFELKMKLNFFALEFKIELRYKDDTDEEESKDGNQAVEK